jgi:SAM-dependent methyltransferase
VNCPICDAPSPTPRLRKSGVDILFCRSCGTAFWRPRDGFVPTAIYDAAYFEGADAAAGYDDYGALEGAFRHNFARRLRRLGAPRAGGRLLDLGSAYGFAVDEARRLGWHAFGLEISRAAARRANDAIGESIVALGDAQSIPFADETFDSVTLWDVLEHLADPHGVMSGVVRVLRPGGRLALTTGDVGSIAARVSGPRWHLYTIPEHLFFYSREGVRRLLSAHGFRIEWMRAEGARYPIGYLIERLRKTVMRRDSGARPHWPGPSIAIPVNLFDVVTVHAVREIA